MSKNELLKVNIQKGRKGKLFVSSRDIAKGLKKSHYDVLKKIREVLGEGEYSASTYYTKQGKEMTEYLLPKNSFILLVMNYQGYNDFKRAYINRFDEMERLLWEKQTPEFKAFIKQDKEHQKKQMTMLQEGIKGITPLEYIKANTIADKAVSTIFGYKKMLKKEDMTAEMLVERNKLLSQITSLMVAQSLGVNIPHISEVIYSNIQSITP